METEDVRDDRYILNDPRSIIRQPFQYLKVVNHENVNGRNQDVSYPLRGATDVHIQYSDNSTYSLSFEIENDESDGFKAIQDGSEIWAGNQIFVIQSITKSHNGVEKISVTANQIVNAYFKRLLQPRYMEYDKNKTDQDSKVYINLDEALHDFLSFIDRMDFNCHAQGWFPKRPWTNLHNFTGDQFLQEAVKVYPGTVIYPRGRMVYFFGYLYHKQEGGKPVPAMQVETGERLDALKDLTDLQVTTDRSGMCNIVRVKSATHQVQQNPNGDSNEDYEYYELSKDSTVDVPYFDNFVAVSDKSIKKWGAYPAADILDDGFTNKQAALAAARERMVLEPVVKVQATVNHPGKTEPEPLPGSIYTVASPQDGEIYHVAIHSYDWYPFDSSKGLTMTLSSVRPGLIDSLRTIVTHDVKQTPEMMEFQELTDTGEEASTDDAGDDTGDDSSDVDDGGDDNGEEVNTDDQTDRPDDDGDPKGKKSSKKSKFKAHLPISDKAGKYAHISRFGGLTVSEDIKNLNIRVAEDPSILKDLANGDWQPQDTSDPNDEGNDGWRHLAKIYWDNSGEWNGKQFYRRSDFYLGGQSFSNEMWTSQSDTLTFRTGVSDNDYYQDQDVNGSGEFKTNGKEFGTLKKYWHKRKDGSKYINATEGRQPGYLGKIDAGSMSLIGKHYKAGTMNGHPYNLYVGRGIYSPHVWSGDGRSQLSKKKNVKPLSKLKAFNSVMNTDIGEYQFKGDKTNQHFATVIIDDVHKGNPQWKTPKAFTSMNMTRRNDSSMIGYLIKTVQYQQDEIKDLKDENDKLKSKMSDFEERLKKLEEQHKD